MFFSVRRWVQSFHIFPIHAQQHDGDGKQNFIMYSTHILHLLLYNCINLHNLIAYLQVKYWMLNFGRKKYLHCAVQFGWFVHIDLRGDFIPPTMEATWSERRRPRGKHCEEALSCRLCAKSTRLSPVLLLFVCRPS